METETQKILDQAKKKIGIKSDYALAKWLGITRQGISNYRHGKSTLDDYTAARLAEALGENPLRLIAQANAERENDAKRKAFWEKLAGNASAGMIALKLTVPGLESVRAENLYDSTHYILCAIRSRKEAQIH